MAALTRVYEVSEGYEAPVYVATFAEAATYAKENLKNRWQYVEIALYEVQSDKEGVLAMVNRAPMMNRLRLWQSTSRGGFKETPNEAS